MIRQERANEAFEGRAAAASLCAIKFARHGNALLVRLTALCLKVDVPALTDALFATWRAQSIRQLCGEQLCAPGRSPVAVSGGSGSSHRLRAYSTSFSNS
jgi:hypothetical protein